VYTYLQGDSIMTGTLDSAQQVINFHYYNIGTVRGSIENINESGYYLMIYGVGNAITGEWGNVKCDSAGYVYFDGLTNISYGGFDWQYWGSSVNWTGSYLIAFNHLNWSSATIDSVLCDLDATAPSPTPGSVIDLRFNAMPSSTGLTCRTSLIGKGWTVQVDE